MILEGNSISGMVIFCRTEIDEVWFWQSGNKSAIVNGARDVVVAVTAVRVAVTTLTTVTVALKLSSATPGVDVLPAASVRKTVVVLVLVLGSVSVTSSVTITDKIFVESN